MKLSAKLDGDAIIPQVLRGNSWYVITIINIIALITCVSTTIIAEFIYCIFHRYIIHSRSIFIIVLYLNYSLPSALFSAPELQLCVAIQINCDVVLRISKSHCIVEDFKKKKIMI